MVSVTVAGRASDILEFAKDGKSIMEDHLRISFQGFSMVIDDNLPKNWIELRDPDTGQVLGTIINVGA